MNLKIAPINHDVLHNTDAETIAKLKRTIAGYKATLTKRDNEIIKLKQQLKTK